MCFKEKLNPAAKKPPNAYNETKDFTLIWLKKGKMTRDEKIRLDNEAIKNWNLSQKNGFETRQEEFPGEWERLLSPKKPLSFIFMKLLSLIKMPSSHAQNVKKK